MFKANEARRKKANAAYQRLKELIVDGEIGHGEQLYIHEVSAMLGMGITPVREAMLKLFAERLISQSPKRGFRTKTIDIRHISDLYDLSHLVLGQVIRDKIEDFTDSGIVSPSIPISPDQPEESNRKARALFIEDVMLRVGGISGNGEIVHIVRRFNEETRFLNLIELSGGEGSSLIEDVESFLVAMVSKDVERAVSALARHIRRGKTRLPLLAREALARKSMIGGIATA